MLQQLSADILPQMVYAYILLLCRLGSMIMLLPGIGEAFISARIRISFAALVCFALFPLLQPDMPPVPAAVPVMVGQILHEILIGLMIGILTRMVLATLEVSGMIISTQMGISAAVMFNPVMATQGSLISVFLTLAGLKMIFITNTHHLFFYAMRDSYGLFPVNGELPIPAMTETVAHTVSEMFRIAVQMSAPFLVLGMVFFVGLGLLSRLMPQIQIFFIALPLQIILGLVLVSLSLSAVMMLMLEFMRETLTPFLN
jgi:flagellar biosynthesis protein FliR